MNRPCLIFARMERQTRMLFRTATPDDVPLLAQFNHHLIQDEGHHNPMTVPELAERMHEWLQSGVYTAVIFEQDPQTPVAYALYRDDGDSIYLRQFFVNRLYRRQGIGRVAIELLLTRVLPTHKPVRLEVLVHNTRGHQFWQAVGFVDYAITMQHIKEHNEHTDAGQD